MYHKMPYCKHSPYCQTSCCPPPVPVAAKLPCSKGPQGHTGPAGTNGSTGPQGATGPAGGSIVDGTVDGQILLWNQTSGDYEVSSATGTSIGTLQTNTGATVLTTPGTTGVTDYPESSVVIGNDALTNSGSAIGKTCVTAIGNNVLSSAVGPHPPPDGITIIGCNAGVDFQGVDGLDGENSIIIGNDAAKTVTIGNSAIGIGHLVANGSDLGFDAIAIGSQTISTGNAAVAIGAIAIADAVGAIAIGGADPAGADLGASATVGHCIAIGVNSSATADSNIAIGYGALADSVKGISIGPDADCVGLNAIAIGSAAVASDNDSIVVGHDAVCNGIESVCIGVAATTGDINSIAIGKDASTVETDCVTIGHGSFSDSAQTVIIGNASSIDPGADNASVIGNGLNAVTSTLHAVVRDWTAGTYQVLGIDTVTGEIVASVTDSFAS